MKKIHKNMNHTGLVIDFECIDCRVVSVLRANIVFEIPCESFDVTTWALRVIVKFIIIFFFFFGRFIFKNNTRLKTASIFRFDWLYAKIFVFFFVFVLLFAVYCLQICSLIHIARATFFFPLSRWFLFFFVSLFNFRHVLRIMNGWDWKRGSRGRANRRRKKLCFFSV